MKKSDFFSSHFYFYLILWHSIISIFLFFFLLLPNLMYFVRCYIPYIYKHTSFDLLLPIIWWIIYKEESLRLSIYYVRTYIFSVKFLIELLCCFTFESRKNREFHSKQKYVFNSYYSICLELNKVQLID